MSVTFFDPENPAQYDSEYNQVDGGPEVNFANNTAAAVLRRMGILDEETWVLYGSMAGEDFRKLIKRGIIVAERLGEDFVVERLERLLNAFIDAKAVSWE